MHVTISYFQPESYLCVSTPIIHHVILGCHVVGLVELGGVKLHLLDPGDPLGGEHPAKAFALVSVLPAQEELLEHGSLSSVRQHLDLHTRQKKKTTISIYTTSVFTFQENIFTRVKYI